MMPIRFALSAIALCAALPAFAGVTTTTSYGFSSSASSATNTASGTNATTTSAGATTWLTGSSTQYGDNGTNYGNTITWAGSTTNSSVTVSAWATTGTGSGTGQKFEKAYIGNYGGDLGITSQISTTNTNELNANNSINQSGPHAIDNVGAYEALMFSFSSATTLSNVQIGYPSSGSGIDSDSTILYWNGTVAGDPTSTMTARTLSDLTSNGWSIATNIGDMTTGAGGNATKLSTSIQSKYWLVGAYMGLGGSVASGTVNTGNDYFKVNGLTTVTASAVPEPGSIALFGIAGAALVAGRRRKARKA